MELSLPAPTADALVAELEALGPALATTWDRRRDLASRALGFASEVVSPRPRTPVERLAAATGRFRPGHRARSRRTERVRALARRFVPASVDSRRSAWSTRSLYSIGSIDSVLSAGSAVSVASACSVLSFASFGSVLSIGSAGSVLSIGSAGSVLAIGGAGVNNLDRARAALVTPATVRAVNLLAVAAVIAAAGTGAGSAPGSRPRA